MITTKTAFITGVTSGIGYASTFKAIELGYTTLILLARNQAKLTKVQEELTTRYPHITTIPLVCDLSDFDDVKATALELQSLVQTTGIDLIINNAGLGQAARTLNKQGFELNLAVNYLSHVILTEHLLPLLNHNAYVLFVSSSAYHLASIDYNDINLEHTFNSRQAYGNSKAYQMVYAQQLRSRHREDTRNIRFEAVHPGVVNTSFGNNVENKLFTMILSLVKKFLISSKQSVERNVFAPLYERNQSKLGTAHIWINGKPKITRRRFMQEVNSNKLWEFTQTALHNYL